MFDIFLIWLTSSLIFGFIGVQIAKNKRVPVKTGFLYGFFLLAIGLIIIALLNPTVDIADPKKEYEEDRDTSAEAYRLWLTEKYNIRRNELLDRFVVVGQSFATVDDAIAYADNLEDLQVEQNREEARRAQVKAKKRSYAAVAALGGFAILIVSKLGYDKFQHHQALSYANSMIDDRKNSIEQTLQPFGINIYPNSLFAEIGYEKLSSERLRALNFWIAHIERSEDGSESCNVMSRFGNVLTDKDAIAVRFRSEDDIDKIYKYYRSELLSKGYRESPLFIEYPKERFVFSGSKNMVWVEVLRLDDGPTYVKICILSQTVMDEHAKVWIEDELKKKKNEEYWQGVKKRTDEAEERLRRSYQL